MFAKLVDFLVPVNHGLELTLDSLDDAVGQELVIVGEQSSGLLGLHVESPAKGIQDKLKSTLSLGWVLSGVHLHDVNSVFDCFPLI